MSGSTLTLIYSGNLDGELEPCGCTLEGDFGGIQRRATLLDELRHKLHEPVVISSGGLLVSGFTSDVLKNEYILKGIAALDYDAIGLQWNDLAFGIEFLRRFNLPWLASNWNDDSFSRVRQITRGEHSLAVFAWLNPETSPYRKMRGSHEMAANDVPALNKMISRAKGEGSTTILMTSVSLAEVEERLSLDDVDILIIKSAYEKYGKPVRDGRTLVLQPGSRGMRLGRLDLTLAQNGDVASWQHEVIPLGVDVPDSPRLQAWYDEYNAKVEAAYRESVERIKAQTTGESPYAGAQACQTCHGEAHEKWQASLHSGAYHKLEEVKKAFDPACIVCHTVGFNKPGGFIDIDTTPQLANVQCESCHGASRRHVDSGGKKTVANTGWPPTRMCAQCHTPAHSPSFHFENYWPKIAH